MGVNRLFGCTLYACTMDSFIANADEAMRTRRRLQHSDINVSKLVDMARDPDLRTYVADSDVVCVDGMGALWASRLLGADVPERVSGVDIMERLIRHCAEHGYRPYFLGAKDGVLLDLVATLQRRYPALDVAGYRNGYFKRDDEAQIVEDIRRSGADCLFVGISSPIKEAFLHRHRDALKVPVQIGVGGSFDVLSGHIPRAPLWMQKSGLEWLFRLLQEPRRLGPRYVKSNVAFLGVVAREFLQMRSDRERATS